MMRPASKLLIVLAMSVVAGVSCSSGANDAVPNNQTATAPLTPDTMKSTTPVPTPTSTTDAAGDEAPDSGQTSTTELPSLAVPGPPDDLSTLLPQLIVHGDDADLELRAVTFCWSDDEVAGACADGVRPNPLPDAGRIPASIAFTFPRDDWQFEARVGAPGGPGGPAVVSMTESQDWTIDLPDRTGPSVVELFGEGPEGDYYVIFTADLGPMGG